MRLTLIGIFSNATNARQAIKHVGGLGMRCQLINDPSAPAGQIDVDGVTDGSCLWNSPEQFFQSLFGSRDDAHHYQRLAGSNWMVVVEAPTVDDAARAHRLLIANGAQHVPDGSAKSLNSSGLN